MLDREIFFRIRFHLIHQTPSAAEKLIEVSNHPTPLTWEQSDIQSPSPGA